MLDRAARAEVEQRDVGAQGHGVTATLAAAGAGDERDLSFEAAHRCAVTASSGSGATPSLRRSASALKYATACSVRFGL
jgi:hypothetical protein